MRVCGKAIDVPEHTITEVRILNNAIEDSPLSILHDCSGKNINAGLLLLIA